MAFLGVSLLNHAPQEMVMLTMVEEIMVEEIMVEELIMVTQKMEMMLQ